MSAGDEGNPPESRSPAGRARPRAASRPARVRSTLLDDDDDAALEVGWLDALSSKRHLPRRTGPAAAAADLALACRAGSGLEPWPSPSAARQRARQRSGFRACTLNLDPMGCCQRCRPTVANTHPARSPTSPDPRPRPRRMCVPPRLLLRSDARPPRRAAPMPAPSQLWTRWADRGWLGARSLPFPPLAGPTPSRPTACARERTATSRPTATATAMRPSARSRSCPARTSAFAATPLPSPGLPSSSRLPSRPLSVCDADPPSCTLPPAPSPLSSRAMSLSVSRSCPLPLSALPTRTRSPPVARTDPSPRPRSPCPAQSTAEATASSGRPIRSGASATSATAGSSRSRA